MNYFIRCQDIFGFIPVQAGLKSPFIQGVLLPVTVVSFGRVRLPMWWVWPVYCDPW